MFLRTEIDKCRPFYYVRKTVVLFPKLNLKLIQNISLSIIIEGFERFSLPGSQVCFNVIFELSIKTAVLMDLFQLVQYNT